MASPHALTSLLRGRGGRVSKPLGGQTEGPEEGRGSLRLSLSLRSEMRLLAVVTEGTGLVKH